MLWLPDHPGPRRGRPRRADPADRAVARGRRRRDGDAVPALPPLAGRMAAEARGANRQELPDAHPAPLAADRRGRRARRLGAQVPTARRVPRSRPRKARSALGRACHSGQPAPPTKEQAVTCDRSRASFRPANDSLLPEGHFRPGSLNPLEGQAGALFLRIAPMVRRFLLLVAAVAALAAAAALVIRRMRSPGGPGTNRGPGTPGRPRGPIGAA